MSFFQTYQSPVGCITMVSEQNALTGLAFEQQRYFQDKVPEDAREKDLKVFRDTKKWLDTYFQGENPDFLPEISLKGTDFQMQVWRILLQIPYGEVVTYGEIAKQIAMQKGIAKMSAQAVGGAVGHNPISIIVPCHRVIGKNGELVGYGGGLHRKTALLKLEKAKYGRR